MLFRAQITQGGSLLFPTVSGGTVQQAHSPPFCSANTRADAYNAPAAHARQAANQGGTISADESVHACHCIEQWFVVEHESRLASTEGASAF